MAARSTIMRENRQSLCTEKCQRCTGLKCKRCSRPVITKNGNVVGIEILDASKRMGDPMSVEYAVSR